MQADALAIEVKAQCRLADEFDAAQARDEIKSAGRPRKKNVPNENNSASVADLGLTRKQVHEARTIRDAEKKNPGEERQPHVEAEALLAGDGRWSVPIDCLGGSAWREIVTAITRRLLGKFGSTLQKHYWENFTPLATSLARSGGTVGGGTQFFKKHIGVADLASKFQA